MKRNCLIMLILVFFGGAISLFAQDIITLTNGDEIKAKVLEITSKEIKYKKYENLDGPTVIVDISKVFAINYENGTREVFNTAGTGTASSQGRQDKPVLMDPNKVYFGIWANPVGFLTFGPMFGFEITKKKINADIHIRIPQLGFMMKLMEAGWDYYDQCKMTGGIGFGAGLKFFLPTGNGGFYVGGLVEYSQYKAEYKGGGWWGEAEEKNLAFGANIGYRFVWKPVYLRLGAYLGAAVTLDGYYKEAATSGSWSNYNDRSGTTIFYLLDLAIGVQF